MPLRRARSSMLRMAMPPVTPAVASSGLFSSERGFIVIGVSSQRDGCIHEGFGGADGEHDARRAARAAAGVAHALAVARLPVPGSGALVIERQVRALAVAGGAVRLRHLVPAGFDGGTERAGEGREGAHHSTHLAGSRVRCRSASLSAHSMSCTVRVMFRLMS